MTEYVVTLRNGQRQEVESTHYECRYDGDTIVHCFTGPPSSPTYDDRVLCVQRRNGHLLEQVWLVEASS